MAADSDTNLRLDNTRTRLSRLAWLLDNSIRLPGGFRLGLDGIVGLLPGIGDLMTAAVSFYIIAKAAFMRVPASILARMGLNVLLELVIGIIPLFGDVFDIVFRANLRNVALIESHLDDPDGTRNQSRWIIVVTLISIVLLLLLAVALTLSLLGMLWSKITT
ncbi:MAG: DUF4112 domain-containing protein [Woeseiaceae bacterium]